MGMPGQTLESYVKERITDSAIVFSGKVVGFEFQKGVPNEYASRSLPDYETQMARFEVERSWKGSLVEQILLATDETRGSNGHSTSSSCDYNFKVGETYLVYAGSRDGFYRTHACAGTRLLSTATDQVKVLGEGNLIKKPMAPALISPLQHSVFRLFDNRYESCSS